MSVLWQDLHEGEGPKAWTFGPLTITDFVRYQGASGDMNPLHHDVDFAKDAGFGAPVAVGMFTAGAMNVYATKWLGAANVRNTRMRWKKPAFPGSELSVGGTVVKKYEEAGERKVDIELVISDSEGQIALHGWMTFVVR